MRSIIKQTLKFWYIPLILGILFTGIGIWAISTPIEAYITLTMLFVFGFIISGILEVVYVIYNRKHLKSWLLHLTGGILGVVLGILLASDPGLSAWLLSLYIGCWLLFHAVMSIGASIEMKKYGEKNWIWLLILGIVGIIFSLFLILNPAVTGVYVGILTGFGFITLGVFNIFFSIRIKKLKNFTEDLEEELEEELEELHGDD